MLVTLDLAAVYPQAEKLLASTRLKRLVVGAFPEYAAAPGPVKAFLAAQGMLSEVPSDERHVAFHDLLDNDGRYQAHPIGEPTEALAVIQYTGGTTGLPKGAMLSHANLTAACAQYLETATRSDPPAMTEGVERTLCVLPLFHIYALSAVLILGLAPRGRDHPPSAFRSGRGRQGHRAQEGHRLSRRADHASRAAEPAGHRTYDLKSLKFCGSGGAPLPVAVQQRFQAVTGCP